MSSERKDDQKEPKKLMWTVRIEKAIGSLQYFTPADRSQYQTDLQALMCSGRLNDSEVNKVRTAIYLEKAVFYASRLFVPFSLFMMYRRGVF